ncbi:MAG: porin family protein [Chlorobium sp.]|nr:porin family protein [Chlorobium sp.]
MKLALLTAGLALAGLSAAPASAADHYVSGNAGITWMNDVDYAGHKAEMEAGFALFGAIGCDYGNTRLEGELGYVQNDVDKVDGANGSGDISVISLMANGYYDIDTGGGIEPYVTAGVGFAQGHAESITNFGTWNETTLAWQVGAGVAVPVADNVMVDLRYRYFDTTDMLDDTNIGSNNLLVGMRVGF